MGFEALLKEFTAAVEAGDGKRLANLFTDDGIYHDTFYGAFQGHDAIAHMLEGMFWRDAEAFAWETTDPVSEGDRGYARWIFSYTSKLPEASGRRVVFEGMSLFRLRDGKIQHYGEIFDRALALEQVAFPPERISRFVGKAVAELRARVAGTRHLPAQD